jgi:hypothetical protein
MTVLVPALLAALVSGPWAALHRPLHLPALAAGAPCPVSPIGRIDFAKYGVAKGIGPGPAYPVGFAQPGSVLQFIYPPAGEFAGSDWGGQKVLWFVAPSYRGPVLIRGGRLDARGTLRFESGKVPPVELRIPATNRALRYRPSYTRLRAPGCYAYQIDGTTFSRVIVFAAATV